LCPRAFVAQDPGSSSSCQANTAHNSLLIDILHNRVRRRIQRFGYRSRTLELDRCTLHYYEREGTGTDKTIVLLHGLGTSSSTWVHLLPKLDPAWNVVAPDLPGFGFSPLRNPRDFFLLSELYDSVVKFLGRSVRFPIVLLGHSLGGWLAARYAAEHGDTLRRLVLVNNAGIMHEETINQARAFDLRTIRDVSRLLNILWRRYPWYFKPFYPAILHDLHRRHVAEFVRSIQPRDFINEDLIRITVPVSLIWGRADRLFATKSVEILKREIPTAQVAFLDECGHVPQLERPKEFIRIVQGILREETA